MIQTTQAEQATKIGNWISLRLDKYEGFIFLALIIVLIIKTSTDMPVSIFIVLSLLSLAIAYFFSGFANINFDYAGGLDIFFHKLISWGCSIGIIAILYRLNNWLYFELFTWIGCGTIMIILPIILYRKSKNPDLKLYNPRYILRIIMICTIGFILAYLPNEVLKKSRIISTTQIERTK
jgi:hypothetical protein